MTTMEAVSLFSGIGGMWYNSTMPRGAKPKQYPDEMVANVRERYAAGATQAEIALALGTTQKVIWNLMVRHDIPRRVAAKRDQRGEKNSSWRGDRATYTAFHNRMYALRGKPRLCETCGTTTARSYDWANMTGRYDDPTDYRRLCRSCHWKYDNTARNLGEYYGLGRPRKEATS